MLSLFWGRFFYLFFIFKMMTTQMRGKGERVRGNKGCQWRMNANENKRNKERNNERKRKSFKKTLRKLRAKHSGRKGKINASQSGNVRAHLVLLCFVPYHGVAS